MSQVTAGHEIENEVGHSTVRHEIESEVGRSIHLESI